MEEKYERLLEIARRLSDSLQLIDIEHVPPQGEQAVSDFEDLLLDLAAEEEDEAWNASSWC